MKKSVAFFLVVGLFFQLFFSEKVIAGSVSDDNLFGKRIEIANEWLGSFNKEFDKINDSKLQEIKDFFSKKVVVAAPRSCGLETLSRNRNKDENIIIIPILKSDCTLNKSWKNFYESKTVLEFFLKERFLFINSRIRFGSKSQALAMAHEGYNALESIIDCGDENQCVRYYDLMEKNARIFQNKLTRILGGPLYLKIVNSESKKVYAAMKKGDSSFGYFIPNPRKYNPKLEKIFGKTKSNDERVFIRMNVWVNAVMIAIEKKYSDNVSEEETLFLKAVCN